MSDEHRLGNDGTETSREAEPEDRDDQMNEKDDEITQPGMISNPKKPFLALFSNSPWPGEEQMGGGTMRRNFTTLASPVKCTSLSRDGRQLNSGAPGCSSPESTPRQKNAGT